MLCVVSGQRWYSRKIFNGKTFAVSKNSQKPRKFSPLNDLTYMALRYIIQTSNGSIAQPYSTYYYKLVTKLLKASINVYYDIWLMVSNLNVAYLNVASYYSDSAILIL